MFFALAMTTAPMSLWGATADETLLAAMERRYEGRMAGGQYMKRNCSETALASYGPVPLLRCKYSELGTTAEVTLLLPDAKRLARWTVTACRDAAATDMEACAHFLELRIWSASNGQFPVRGYVIEPKSVLGGSSSEPFCFLFRDGVTVRTETVSSRPPQGSRCVPQDAENERISGAFKYARVASTTRAEFAKAPGAPAEAAMSGTAFPDAVRDEFVAAWNADRNRLISGSAIAAKAARRFR